MVQGLLILLSTILFHFTIFYGVIQKNIDNIRLIAIAGPSSSGKTTFSKNLSKKYDIKRYELDKVSWDDENGNIKNAVNYPNCDMGKCSKASRITILHKNIPNMITAIAGIFADDGGRMQDRPAA